MTLRKTLLGIWLPSNRLKKETPKRSNPRNGRSGWTDKAFPGIVRSSGPLIRTVSRKNMSQLQSISSFLRNLKCDQRPTCKTIGGRFWTNALTGEISSQQVANEGSFTDTVLSDEKYLWLCCNSRHRGRLDFGRGI